MNNNYHHTISKDADECLSKGICSVSPALSSIQEIILLYVKELSFYVLKLNDFGAKNEAVKELIIYALFNIVTNSEYNQEQFHQIISKLYESIVNSKSIYERYCSENGLEIEQTKSYFKYSSKFDLTDAIRKGEKYFIKKNSLLSLEQKNIYDIIFFLVKSMIIKIHELKRLGKDDNEVFLNVLSLLETIRKSDFSEEIIKVQIKTAINSYYQIIREVFYAQIELYGEVSPAKVSFTTEAGKAILVSGSDMKKLEEVLDAVKNTGISVYTHGLEMFMAHAFKKFRSNPNLKGHYGSGMDSSVIDFATFPGAILMTRCTLQRVEYLFRGRLFTLDPIPPMGVIRIKDNNFEPLIKSALSAKGFSKRTERPSMNVGFDDNQIKKKVNDVISKIDSGKIKQLYFFGLINYQDISTEYFDKFAKLMPKDCFAFSLGYNYNKENIFHENSFCDYSLFYKTLLHIREVKSLKDIDITVFITKCDKHTIANILYLKEIGIKNIYTCKCPSSLINPALIETLKHVFGIKELTEPQKDLSDTLIK